MRVALVALCLIAAGCGQSVDLSKPVSVDALLTEWGSNAGRVREWDGKQVTVTGQLGVVVEGLGDVRYTVELLSEGKPADHIQVRAVEVATQRRYANVVAIGKLEIGELTLRLRDAKVSGR